MTKKTIIKDIVPELVNDSSFPVFVRLFNLAGNPVEYKPGVIPFFFRTFGPPSNLSPIISELRNSFVTSGSRIPKEYIFSNFHVYKIPDLGAQSLSPGFKDFTPMCFNGGYKILQKDIIFLKNYTSKEIFIFIPIGQGLISGDDNEITVIFKPRDFTYSSQVVRTLTRGVDGKFSFNFSDPNMYLNSLDEISISTAILGNDIDYSKIIPNSSYFLDGDVADFADNTTNNEYISQQRNYFDKLSRNQSLRSDKKYLNLKVTLNENLKENTIYVKSTQIASEFYYDNLSNLNNPQSGFSTALPKCPLGDVYKREGSRARKLNAGVDYWINQNGNIMFADSDISSLYEVFLNEDRKQRISIPFSISNQETFVSNDGFNIKAALYENNMLNWNINLDDSTITFFEDGVLKAFTHQGQSSFENYAKENFSVGKGYNYIIEDISFNGNGENPPAKISNPGVLYLNDLPGRIFPDLKQYQITTDPYLLTCGEESNSSTNTQEVYLYNKNLNFKIERLEPKIEYLGNKYVVNGMNYDPYDPSINSAIGEIENDLKGFQEDSLETILKTRTGSAKTNNVQAIEGSLTNLKLNFIDIVNNSQITYAQGPSNGEIPGDFLFLVIKKESGSSVNSFDLIYYNSNGDQIKKEYGCAYNNGIYISVPHFAFNKVKVVQTHQRETQSALSNSNYQYYSFK